MPIPVPTLRHLLPVTPVSPHLTFCSSTTLLHTANARVILTDAVQARSRTFPHESSRPLISLSHPPSSSLYLTLDGLSRLTLHSLPTSSIVARLSLTTPTHSAALSPNASFVAVTGSCVQVWKLPLQRTPFLAHWTRLYRFPVDSTCVTWSPDSTRLAVASGRNVIVYSLSERESGVNVKPLTLHGHRAAVIYVGFVGARGLITVSTDGLLLCWRLRYCDDDGECEKERLRFASETRNPKRKYFRVPLKAKLASRHFVKRANAQDVRCVDIVDTMLVAGFSNGVFAILQLPEHMMNETLEFDNGLFEIANLRKRKKQGSQADDCAQLDAEIPSVPFSDLQDLHTLSVSKAPVVEVKFNPGGEWVALATSEGHVLIWDWQSETHVLKQQAHTLSINAAAFSPDGRAIATGGRDAKLKLWRLASGFCTATFSNHTAAITDVMFAKNDVIVTASLDGSVRAFDTRRYRNFRTMVGPTRTQFGCVAADESGDLIAAGCVDTFEIIVWSLRTGQVLEMLNGHKGPVSAIAFRPRRGTLVSSSWDRTVRLWDMYERKGSCEVLEHSKEVLSVAFRPDGEEFASCTSSGEIVLWNAEKGEIVGTIDGARDAGAGRSRESRNIAQEKGSFNSVSYTADGQFIIAGAASKNVCIYHVAEGTRPALVEKVAVTRNTNFDGVVDKLNSKFLTSGGYDLEAIDDEDEDAADYQEAVRAGKRSLPGARAEEQLRRKKLVKAEVLCVSACRTGRLWGAVSNEGVLIYGEDDSDEFGNAAFDPNNLDIDITPSAAMGAVKRGNYQSAMLVALRLNDRNCLNTVVEAVPVERIGVVVGMLPVMYFGQLVRLFAWRLEHTRHLEFNLMWSKRLLISSADKSRGGSVDPLSVHSALRALYRACSEHTKRLRPLADKNENMLRYLATVAERSAREKNMVET